MLTFMRRAILAVAIILLVAPALASHVLEPDHRRVLDAWLKQHPTMRLATDKDCGCEEDIQRLRTQSGGVWKPVPDYHPYVAVGDFNGDRTTDFAVVLVDTAKTTKVFTLVIFNGPFGAEAKSPAFLKANLDLTEHGLFFGPPRPKPYRLVLGPFESEGSVFEPQNATYKLVYYEH